MYLSAELVTWAIRTLGKSCHPFIGITFLAAKKEGLPVGSAITTSLDGLTRSHLREYHRLAPKSEFFFQPFRSNRDTYWVAANYSSSGLQAINTQTFKDAFIHPRGSRRWGWTRNYVGRIRRRIEESSMHQAPSLAALAVWTGKEDSWEPGTDIEHVIWKFLEDFDVNDKEIDRLFDKVSSPKRGIKILSRELVDLEALAYSFSVPPDAPSQTEGALTSLRLRDIGPASRAYLQFGERLTLIAGDNGLGKSFLLDAAWWALTGTWAGHPAYPFGSPRTTRPRIEYSIRNETGTELLGKCTFDWGSHAWKDVKNRPSVAALSIYTRVDGSFAIVDETRGQLQAGGPKTLSFFSGREVWEGKAGEIEGLIRDWVTWQQSSDTDAFEMLARVLEHLSPEDTGPLVPADPVRIPGDPRRIPTITQVYGNVPVVFASAGIQRVLLLTYLIIWSWQEHVLASEQAGVPPKRKMVIVVDELEAHLHPKWQRLVLPGLMSIGRLLSSDLEIQVIAATHSPMVLASVEDEFSDESDVLAHLLLNEGKVELERLEYYKYGDMSTWLTSPIFGLPHARSRAAEKVIEDAKDLQLSESPNLDAVRE
ncbi:MAG: AAA family ATPase, partial [Rhodothermaceae bacterium]|nr:AAA family ATPase [Rhodothermaceae bacterium]